jgi:hypothetical protein
MWLSFIASPSSAMSLLTGEPLELTHTAFAVAQDFLGRLPETLGTSSDHAFTLHKCTARIDGTVRAFGTIDIAGRKVC